MDTKTLIFINSGRPTVPLPGMPAPCTLAGMDKIPLNIEPRAQNQGQGQGTTAPVEPKPMLGYIAVGFGLLGIFGPALFFMPLCLVFSVLALLRGQGTWGFVGLLLVVGGFLSSPVLMGLVGLGALWMTIDWPQFLDPILHLFDGGRDV